MTSNKIKSELINYFLLLLTLALVCYPRFNRQDIGIIKNYTGRIQGQPSLGDAEFYLKYVEYIKDRDSVDPAEIDVPYLYRPLVPMIAASMSFFNPMTALNVINLLCLAMAVLFFVKWLSMTGFSFRHSIIGGYLFVVSFPVFYYGTVGYLDPCVLPVLTFGLLLIYTNRFNSLGILIFAGVFIKETVLILIPVALVYLMVQKKPVKKYLIILLLAYIIPNVFLRILFLDVGHGLWHPNMPSFADNFRLRTLLSWTLTLGLPGLGAVFFILHYSVTKRLFSKKVYYPVYAGGLFVLMITAYSFISVYTDGRFLWPLTVFTIPLTLAAVFYRDNN